MRQVIFFVKKNPDIFNYVRDLDVVAVVYGERILV